MIVRTTNVEECPACPCDVQDDAQLAASIGVMFDGIQPICSSAQKDHNVDFLLIGLGGGTLHRHVRKECPEGTRVRSVEIDGRVAGVAERYFGLELADGVSEIDVTDALNAVRRLSSSRASSRQNPTAFLSSDTVSGIGAEGFDAVAIDCFIGHGETPEDCRSSEFVTAVRSILKPSGVVLHHIWHTSPDNSAVAPEFKETLALYQNMFGNNTVVVKSIPRNPSVMWDDVIVARNGGDASTGGNQLAKAEAEAERLRLKAAAFDQYKEAALVDIVLDVMPKVAAEIAAPLNNTNKISMISSGDGEIGASRVAKEVLGIMEALPDVVQKLTGVDITSDLKSITSK